MWGGSLLSAVLKDEDDRLSLPETRIVLSIFLPIRVQQEQVKPDQQRSSRPLIKSSLSLINKYRSWSRQSFTQWTGKRTATSERRTLSLDFALPPRSASPCTGKSSSLPVSWLLASFSTRFKFQSAYQSSDAFLKGGKAVRTCASYRRVRRAHRDMSHLPNRQELLTSASEYSMLVSPIQ